MAPMDFFNIKVDIVGTKEFVINNNSFKNYKKSSIPLLIFVLGMWLICFVYLENYWYYALILINVLFLIYVTYFWATLKFLHITSEKVTLAKYNIIGWLKKEEFDFAKLQRFSFSIGMDNKIGNHLTFLKSVSFFARFEGNTKPTLLIKIPLAGKFKNDANNFCLLLNRMLDDIRASKPLDATKYDPKAYMLSMLQQ